MNTTYRIVPRRGAYELEAITGSSRRTVKVYSTEEAATVRLKRLEAMREASRQVRQVERGPFAVRKVSNGR